MRVPRQPAYHRPEPPPGPAHDPAREPGSRARRRRWPRWVALGVAGLLAGTAAVGWALMHRLDASLTTDVTTAEELARHAAQRPPPAPGDARNILLIGTDEAKGPGGGQRSDAVVLLHLDGDRRGATAVSVPRDLMVDIPSCTPRDGGPPARARRAPFNWAYETGGAACTIRTLERLTDIRVDHHVIVDFAGFADIIDALGGVELCLEQPLRDRPARLRLPAGWQTLNGDDALAFVRARKEVGDGSDTARMARQQDFLDALTRKVESGGVLLNPAKLFPVLDAAASSITTDTGLGSFVRLYDLLRDIRSVPSGNFHFLTLPRTSDPADPNRDVLRQPAANELFTRLRRDDPAPATAAPAGGPPPAAAPRADVCKETWNR